MPAANSGPERSDPLAGQEGIDWKFAFERSEVMRAFQQELLVSIGHELRNPLSSQMGALQLVLSDLCDSPEEEREYLRSAKEAVERLIKLLEEYTHLARHNLPIQPLQPQPVQLRPLLQDVYDLTRLQAQDQGIRYTWPVLQPHAPEPADPFTVWADPYGLVQALLGVCRWGIRTLRYGSMALQVDPAVPGREKQEKQEKLCLQWNLEGRCHMPIQPEASAAWRVSERLLREMGGKLELGESSTHRLEIRVTLRTAKGEESPKRAGLRLPPL